MQAFSLLDLAPIIEGGSARQALLNSRALAVHAERLGYKRFWMAEHHNSTGIASAATAVALGFVAEATRHIRIGAAGIMLPNHSPLIIAEQFGTLASLYPGRVDLGLGRAPGTDGKTAYALRRENFRADETFPQDVRELQDYFAAGHDGIKAVPGHGLQVPLWILGSSLFGAQLAAALGLPYLFASHFAPAALDQALAVYRQSYRPSEAHPTPYAGAAINVFAADTLVEGERLKRGMMQGFISLRRGQAGPLKPPVDDLSDIALPQEIAMAEQVLSESAVGTHTEVKAFIDRFLARTSVDELILTCHAYDHDARIRSFEIAAEVLADETGGRSSTG
ncbi:MAG TPA: LLM class flavin-dependent oxidoreductase [Hyphomicrobiales bacterium]|nr:LLM class flavin-dependent oxidoreductase [Hyphomicrobiales bacterium]